VRDLTKSGPDGVPLLIKEMNVHPGSNDGSKTTMRAVSLSQQGSLLAAAFISAGEMHAVIWVVATGEKYGELPLKLLLEPGTNRPRDEVIMALHFSPDDRLLVTGGSAERAVIWQVGNEGKPTECPPAHAGKIRSVAFSPDGKTFATASGDTTLILWDAHGRQLGPPLTGHDAPVITAAFSADGKWLASGSDDHSVILWDVETGQRIARLIRHTDPVRAVAFSPDGKGLLSGSFPSKLEKDDGGLIRWNLDPAALQAICQQRANRNLTRAEWNAYIGGGRYHKTLPDRPVPGDEPPPK
jgi:hypothetical protein